MDPRLRSAGVVICISRAQPRERIETLLVMPLLAICLRISRAQPRERIETFVCYTKLNGIKKASPGLSPGSGLKHYYWRSGAFLFWASPGLSPGSGLKHSSVAFGA